MTNSEYEQWTDNENIVKHIFVYSLKLMLFLLFVFLVLRAPRVFHSIFTNQAKKSVVSLSSLAKRVFWILIAISSLTYLVFKEHFQNFHSRVFEKTIWKVFFTLPLKYRQERYVAMAWN